MDHHRMIAQLSASSSQWCTALLILAIKLISVDCDMYNHNINNNFQSVPTTIKTFENDTVLLPCNHERPFRSIKWLFQNFSLVDTKYEEFSTPPERMHLWPNGSLQVSNLRQQDTGEYYCQMMTIGGLAQQTHAIEVQYPASADLSPSGVIETYIGSVVELFCNAKGVPTPLISWRHQDVDLEENTQRLLIEINSKDQSGMVDCGVSNNVGEPANVSALLLVQFAPEVTALKTIVHTQNNMKTELECVVSAMPVATVHWFHNGPPMMPDNRITKIDTDMTNKTQTDYYTIHKHTLRIRSIRDNDLGQYECRAENKIGFKGVQFELTGQPMPASFKLSPVPSMQTTYNLIWQTESLSRIHEYKLRFRKVPSGNVTPNNRYAYIPWTEFVIPSENSPGPIHGMGYTLKGLVAGSVYEVVVQARNKYGWSDDSKVLRFATTGEIEPTSGYTTELYADNEVSEQSSSYYDYENSAPASLTAGVLLLTWMIVAHFSLS